MVKQAFCRQNIPTMLNYYSKIEINFNNQKYGFKEIHNVKYIAKPKSSKTSIINCLYYL